MKRLSFVLCAVLAAALLAGLCACAPADPCADGHTPETLPAKAATCVETGLTEGSVCSVCGEVLVAQNELPVDPDNHQAAKQVGCILPTPVKNGYSGDTVCEDCGATLAAGIEMSNDELVNLVSTLTAYGYQNNLPRTTVDEMTPEQRFELYESAFTDRFYEERVATVYDILWIFTDGRVETDHVLGKTYEEINALTNERWEAFPADDKPMHYEHFSYLSSQEVLDRAMKDLFGRTFSFEGLYIRLWGSVESNNYALFKWDAEQNGVVYDSIIAGGFGGDPYFFTGEPVSFDAETGLTVVDVYENYFDYDMDDIVKNKVDTVSVRLVEVDGAYKLAEYIPAGN